MSDRSITAYPLCWPAGWARNQEPRVNGNFKRSITEARDYLINQLYLMGADSVIVSSNAVLNYNGSISARQPRIDDTGVAVYFELDGEQRCIPCDEWVQLEHNLNAIGLTVEALRGIARWGTKQMVSAGFAGFAALPASTGGDSWWDVLDLNPANATAETVDRRFRELAREHHPDRGGSVEAFARLNTAYEQAKAALR